MCDITFNEQHIYDVEFNLTGENYKWLNNFRVILSYVQNTLGYQRETYTHKHTFD